MTKLYLAHPITGLSGDEVFGYYDKWVKELTHTGFEILYPMTAKGHLRTESNYKSHGYDKPVSTDKAIVGRDSWMVNQADIVLIDLTGAEQVSIGCVSELAWAWCQGKHTIVVMNDDNPHCHAFILHQAHIIFPTMDDALEYLYQLATGDTG